MRVYYEPSFSARTAVRNVLAVMLFLLLALRDATGVSEEDRLVEKEEDVERFLQRYNSSRPLDLVFVLDRSGSLTMKGWSLVRNFVDELLQNFTVDADNTRVAVITYSDVATVDINDISVSSSASSRENKCTLMKRLRRTFSRKRPYGHTATYNALNMTQHILIDSRPEARKVVILVTDGKSNLGPPPVRAARRLASMRWTQHNDQQLQIYAIGIHNADMNELRSISHQSMLIPDFKTMAVLARRLHRDQPLEEWIITDKVNCQQDQCRGGHSHCLCGTKSGSYQCGCAAGYQRVAGVCEACPEGTFKATDGLQPCESCPANTTTSRPGAYSAQFCEIPPHLRRCGPLPDIDHGGKFYVEGSLKDEKVYDTNISCDTVTAGNSCHYRCLTGYRLTSSPVIVCNMAAEWEGTIPHCEVVDCQRMVEREGVDIVYLTNSTTFNSRARLTCEPGRLPLGGAMGRCDRYGWWTASEEFRCQEMWCPVPPRIPGMILSPSRCLSEPQRLHSTCSVGCLPGYVQHDVTRTTCQMVNNTILWDPPLTDTICQDVEAPVIECPAISETLQPGERWVVIDLSPTKMSDNSGLGSINITIVGRPDGDVFYRGTRQLRYEARDAAGNVAVCQRQITVRGNDVHMIYCPRNISVTANSANGRSVHWQHPVFRNLYGDLLRPICNRQNGSTFGIADTLITCYAAEYPGTNSNCHFWVTVAAPECPVPTELIAPSNGALVCMPMLGMAKGCQVQCEDGFQKTTHAYLMYKCDYQGKWDQTGKTECVKARRGSSAHMAGEVRMTFTGSCPDHKEEIKQNFLNFINHILGISCTENNVCHPKHVQVVCGEGRRRRSAMTGNGDSSVRITFVLRAQLPGSVTEPPDGAGHSLLTILDNVDSIILNNVETFKNLSLEIGGDILNATTYSVYEYPEIELNCLKGEANVSSYNEAYCYPCPAGTRITRANTCERCPLGWYQDQAGRDTCRQCPDGTNTTFSGAHNSSFCRGRCLPGEFSSSGLEPCQACQKGAYQSEHGATECRLCPDGYSTPGVGSTNSTQCKVKCSCGHYSLTGLVPCLPCPLHTVQPTEGAQSCIPCPDYMETTTNASTTFQDCILADHCQDQPGVCGTRGICRSIRGGATCLCTGGFTGPSCDDPIENSCVSESGTCQHGGTSVGNLDYCTCTCPPQYTGHRCEIETNNCEPNPCHNDAICEQLPGNFPLRMPTEHQENRQKRTDGTTRTGGLGLDPFRCHCAPGYTGTLCGTHLVQCQPGFCVYGKCSHLRQANTCFCNEGYTGERCDARIDFCAVEPCGESGRCHNVNGSYECICHPGRTGHNCELTLDACVSHPCKNNAICWSATGSEKFFCHCHPPYAGPLCQDEVDARFDLVYPTGDVSEYVLVRGIPEMRAFTLCLWLRTEDVMKYGTLASYAVHNNTLRAHDVRADVITLVDYGLLRVLVNGEVATTDITLNDGHWHHVCLTWEGEDGAWTVYVNGSSAAGGRGLAAGTHIDSGGYLVIGQHQSVVGGGFRPREGFMGEMSQFHVFNTVLNATVIRLLSETTTCRVDIQGNVVAWTSVLGHLFGGVRLRNTSFCLDVNECLYPEAPPCPQHRKCVDLIGSYECDACAEGWAGESCDQRTDVCASLPCFNEGKCLTTGEDTETFVCECPPKYTGQFCETEVFWCPKKCQNGGVCVATSAGGHGCKCTAPFHGEACESSSRNYHCLFQPCLNKGVCTRTSTSTHPLNYTCVCPDGYMGPDCGKHVPGPCRSNPCANGADCHAVQYGYVCSCRGSWQGTHCSVRYETTCDPSPCLNNGTCSKHDQSEHGYVCHCPRSDHKHFGRNCEYLPPCDSAPCLNGGSCLQKANGDYDCHCKPGFQEPNCVEATTRKSSTESMMVSKVNEKMSVQNHFLVIWTGVAVAIVLVLLLGLIIIAVACWRKKWKSRYKIKSLPPILLHNHIQTPQFGEGQGHTPPTSAHGEVVENTYAEVGDFNSSQECNDLQKSYMSDVEAKDLSGRFPSKQGREVNHDWDRSQWKGPPKVKNTDEAEDYLTPVNDSSTYSGSCYAIKDGRLVDDLSQEEFIEPVGSESELPLNEGFNQEDQDGRLTKTASVYLDLLGEGDDQVIYKDVMENSTDNTWPQTGEAGYEFLPLLTTAPVYSDQNIEPDAMAQLNKEDNDTASSSIKSLSNHDEYNPSERGPKRRKLPPLPPEENN